MIDIIKTGDRVEINTNPRVAGQNPLVSQVEENMGNGEILIHMPINYGKFSKLSENISYSVVFFTDKGMVRFDAVLVSHKREEDFLLELIRLKGDGEKIQRREFYRFNCLLPIKFTPLTGLSDHAHIPAEAFQDGIAKDISGGGIRFVSNYDLSGVTEVECILMLNNSCVVIKGRILQRQFFPKSNYKYQYRVLFSPSFRMEQEKIITYIFDEQRKTMGKIKPLTN